METTLQSKLSRSSAIPLAILLLGTTSLLLVPRADAYVEFCMPPVPCVDVDAPLIGDLDQCVPWLYSCPRVSIEQCTQQGASRTCEPLASFDMSETEVCISYQCNEAFDLVCLSTIQNCDTVPVVCLGTNSCSTSLVCVSVGSCSSDRSGACDVTQICAGSLACVSATGCDRYPALVCASAGACGAELTCVSLAQCSTSPVPIVAVNVGASPQDPSIAVALRTPAAWIEADASQSRACLTTPNLACVQIVGASDASAPPCQPGQRFVCTNALVETDDLGASAKACGLFVTVCQGGSVDSRQGTVCLEGTDVLTFPSLPNGVCFADEELVSQAWDADDDEVSNADELQGNSDPTNRDSRPDSDDDCDLKPNEQERDLLAARGIGHQVIVVGDYGFEVDPDPNNPSVDVLLPRISTEPEGDSSCP